MWTEGSDPLSGCDARSYPQRCDPAWCALRADVGLVAQVDPTAWRPDSLLRHRCRGDVDADRALIALHEPAAIAHREHRGVHTPFWTSYIARPRRRPPNSAPLAGCRPAESSR